MNSSRRTLLSLLAGAAIASMTPAAAEAADPLRILAGVVRRIGNTVRIRVRIIVNWAGVVIDQVLGIYDIVIGTTKRIAVTILGLTVKCAMAVGAAAATISVTLKSAIGEISKRITIAVPVA